LVFAGDVTRAEADANEGRLCYPGTLDTAGVEGKIVLCLRGVIARTDKSLAVQQAGGVGMVLANTGPTESLNGDFHSIPSIHVNSANGAGLQAYIANGTDPTAIIGAGVSAIVEASEVAGFSSRGPALAGNGDILKPDIMAPGVDVIAAVSPAGYNGNNFDALSGTSMSSPHMAGLGALMKQRYPNWSPAAIKSAFMTTATQSTNQGNPIAGGPFGYGAGFVVPNRATNPGLVYDAGFDDWLAFLCGTGQLTATYCSRLAIDPSDLNYPSIAVGALVGSQTVTRTVTNVGEAASYVASIELPGFTASVSPSNLSLAKGERAEYTVTLTNESAPLNSYASGAIIWEDGSGNSVRSPIVVRPVEIDAPAAVSGTGVTGSVSFDVSFGYSGDYAALPRGLAAANTFEGNVVDDPANDINTALVTDVGITVHPVAVPAGTVYQRFALFDDYTDGNDDLDLYVFGPSGYVGGSGSATSAEQVDVENPDAGTYFVVVHGWETDGPDANYTLFSWSVGADEGNMSITAPNAAVVGTSGSVTVEWNGLDEETKYLGRISHQNGTGEIAHTLFSVETD
ncbi:MAG: S8 family serine peptidase, partial [Haliea sp.]